MIRVVDIADHALMTCPVDEMDNLVPGKGSGYVHGWVSVFARWLSNEEAGACRFLFHRLAQELGALDEYSVGEQQFLQLYMSWAASGVYFPPSKQTLCARADREALTERFIASLREDRLMDAVFLGPEIRIHGGYDRTDELLALGGAERLAQLRKEISGTGLHWLDLERTHDGVA